MGFISTTKVIALSTLAVCCGSAAQAEDYPKAVLALEPDHYYRLNESELGSPRLDENGNPVPVADAGGIQYDDVVTDSGVSPTLIDGYHEGRFDPQDASPQLGLVGVQGPGPGLCGFDDATNLAFYANNAASINLGPGSEFADDVMTVAAWFTANGSDGGDRIFTNNRPDRSDHFQITLGGSANLVIGIDPTSETVLDSLQVPDSAIPVKNGQWHHVVASRNGPTMKNVLVVIDGVDYTSALVDSTTGWGATGTDAHIASRPGGDGGPNHQTLNGYIDEVAVWLGRQLTVAESIDLYNAAVSCIPPGAVVRDLSSQSYRAGEEVLVSLAIAADAPGQDLTLQETVPADGVVSEISDGGSLVDTFIQWDLTQVLSKAVTYKITGLACAGDLTLGTSYFLVGPSKGRVTGKSLIQRGEGDQDLGGWKHLDVGTTGGFTDTLGDHQLFVAATGAGIKQLKDEFHFIYTEETGDFEVSTRIDCLSDPSNFSQAGLMVRDTLDPFAAHAYFSFSPSTGAGLVGNLKGLLRRETLATRTSSPITISTKEVFALPVYLKLKRTGTKISFQRSPDGVTYSEVATKDIGTTTSQINLRDQTLVGLAVTAGGSPSAHAIFGEVSGPPFTPTPAGPTFRRGDADSSGTIDISDAVGLLGYLFLGAAKPDCLEAADFDDNGVADISDAVANLGYQFLGAAAPAAPGPVTCGPDPVAETPALGCQRGCN
jgi:hypothetical protein